ncbi:unnamed protein product [Sphacelaria rigidula]
MMQCTIANCSLLCMPCLATSSVVFRALLFVFSFYGWILACAVNFGLVLCLSIQCTYLLPQRQFNKKTTGGD